MSSSDPAGPLSLSAADPAGPKEGSRVAKAYQRSQSEAAQQRSSVQVAPAKGRTPSFSPRHPSARMNERKQRQPLAAAALTSRRRGGWASNALAVLAMLAIAIQAGATRCAATSRGGAGRSHLSIN